MRREGAPWVVTVPQKYDVGHEAHFAQVTGNFLAALRTGNKPFFHPLSVAGGPSLTQARPDDHPWHYGLWLSWKYINGVNYWEESRETNRHVRAASYGNR